MDNKKYLNQIIKIEIDRPYGSKHPRHGFIYPINYGYVPNTTSGDGEELDAYLLGVFEPVKEYTGKVDMKALEKHINKLDWTEGNRFMACQKLSPRLISQVSMEELLKLIPDGECLNKDHLFVIRNKYKYYEKHKYEIEKEIENK